MQEDDVKALSSRTPQQSSVCCSVGVAFGRMRAPLSLAGVSLYLGFLCIKAAAQVRGCLHLLLKWRLNVAGVLDTLQEPKDWCPHARPAP